MEREGRKGIFAQEREHLQHHSRSIVGALVLACIGVATVWFLLVSGHWTVTSIETEGLHELSREEVASSTYAVLDHGSWKPWNRRNIFYVQPQKLASQLQEALFAEKVTVEKVYPNVLRLMIGERQRSVVLVSKGQILIVDTNGLVTAEADEKIRDSAQQRLTGPGLSGANDLPLIQVDLPEPATVGFQTTGTDTIKMLIRAYKALQDTHVAFKYLLMPTLGSTELQLVTDQKYRVIMDLTQALDVQVLTYQKFIVSMPKGTQIHEYVDVRVPGKAFVR